MPTRTLVVYCSTYGHVHQLAGNPQYVEAQKKQESIPEVAHDDLRWADGICWGSPTRFGNMTAQLKALIDSLVPLLHLGMIFFGTPYGQNAQILVTDAIAGAESPASPRNSGPFAPRPSSTKPPAEPSQAPATPCQSI